MDRGDQRGAQEHVHRKPNTAAAFQAEYYVLNTTYYVVFSMYYVVNHLRNNCTKRELVMWPFWPATTEVKRCIMGYGTWGRLVEPGSKPELSTGMKTKSTVSPSGADCCGSGWWQGSSHGSWWVSPPLQLVLARARALVLALVLSQAQAQTLL